jgi:hypothetical protein
MGVLSACLYEGPLGLRDTVSEVTRALVRLLPNLHTRVHDIGLEQVIHTC